MSDSLDISLSAIINQSTSLEATIVQPSLEAVIPQQPGVDVVVVTGPRGLPGPGIGNITGQYPLFYDQGSGVMGIVSGYYVTFPDLTSASGAIVAQINASAAGVGALNGLSGLVSIAATNPLFVSISGQSIYVSGSGLATSGDVNGLSAQIAATGSYLYSLITGNTGVAGLSTGVTALNGLTGAIRLTGAGNITVSVDGQTITVSGLNSGEVSQAQLNALSGYVNAQDAATGQAAILYASGASGALQNQINNGSDFYLNKVASTPQSVQSHVGFASSTDYSGNLTVHDNKSSTYVYLDSINSIDITGRVMLDGAFLTYEYASGALGVNDYQGIDFRNLSLWLESSEDGVILEGRSLTLSGDWHAAGTGTHPNSLVVQSGLWATGSYLYSVITGNTGTANVSGFITTGQADVRYYPLATNPSGYITTGQTGQFYPASNPQAYATSGDIVAVSGSLSTAIAQTGAAGIAYTNGASGALNTTIIATGSSLYVLLVNQSGQGAADYATKTQISSTGAYLYQTLTGLSGQSQTDYATKVDLINTGIVLQGRIDSLSGFALGVSGNLEQRIFLTGAAAVSYATTYANSVGLNTSGTFSLTGANLQGQINNLSQGTASQTWQWQTGSSGNLIKNTPSGFILRNYMDTQTADLTVYNLTVEGTQFINNTTNLGVANQYIYLNVSGAPQDGGIVFLRSGDTASALKWNESLQKWQAGFSGTESTIILASDTGQFAAKTQLTVTGQTLYGLIVGASGYAENIYVHRTGNELISGNKLFTGKVSIGTSRVLDGYPQLFVSRDGVYPYRQLYSSDVIMAAAESSALGVNLLAVGYTGAGYAPAQRGVFKGTRARLSGVGSTGYEQIGTGDMTVSLLGAGYDGYSDLSSAAITFMVDAPVSSGVLPQAIVFEVGTGGYSLLGAPRSERMRITSSGYVGIGIPNPAFPLVVSGRIQAFSTTDGHIDLGVDMSNRLAVDWDESNHRALIQGLRTGLNNAPIILNPSGGSVGVGIDNPGLGAPSIQTGTLLHVRGNSAGDYYPLILENVSTGSTDRNKILLRLGGYDIASVDAYPTGGLGLVSRYDNSGYMDFVTRTNGAFALRMRLTNSGAFGIGMQRPSGLLHVNGSIWSESGFYSGSLNLTDILYPRSNPSGFITGLAGTGSLATLNQLNLLSGYVDAQDYATGRAAILYASGASGGLETRIVATGQSSVVHSNGVGSGLSGNLTQTGVTLGAKIDTLSGFVGQVSGGLEARILQTGTAAVAFANGIGTIVSGNLTQTGATLQSRINSLSGFVTLASGGLETRIFQTGAAAILYASGVGTATSGALTQSGIALMAYANGVGVNLSGQLQITGSSLYVTLTGMSGAFDTKIASTGQQAWTAANNNGTNLSGNLTLTGQTLQTRINSLSGFVGLASGGLEARIFQTGASCILYASGIGVSTSGSLAQSGTALMVYANGIGTNLSGNLTLTGQALQTRINSLSGFILGASGELETRIVQTGAAAVAHANGIGAITSGNLTITGQTLNNRIGALSGWASPFNEPNVTVVSNYSIVGAESRIYCNNPNPIILTFPSAVTLSGYVARVKLINTGSVLFTGVFGQSFDGYSSYQVVGQYAAREVHSNGVNWYLW